MGTKPAESAIAHSETNSAALPRQKLTYQVILRHLVKFRDGARAVLDIFDKQAAGQPPAATEQAQASPSETLPAPRPAPPAAEEKTPLQLRIEQHMDSVDRALKRRLDPRAASGVEQVEGHTLRAGGGEQLDGNRGEAERDVQVLDGARHGVWRYEDGLAFSRT